MGSYDKSPYDDGLEDPVVIVGLSFRFPGDAVSEESFWELLRDGRNMMTEVPTSRYNINGHYCDATGRQHGVTARGGHFIKGDISAFDAPFFKMSAAEAKAMDPQLRILLETTYHALETANLTLEDVAGSNTSVYVGSLSQEYDSLFAFDEEIDAKYQAIGTSSSMLSNRVSWFYDLRGSSVTVDTACSSSLIGLHHGCHSLLQGESDMSLVGGVQLQLEPRKMTAAVSRLGFLSPDSQCYSFDDRANGYSRGEGVAMLVLKRLSRALEDGDTIRAVIRGTSTNQDGRTPSITAPSAAAQAALIKTTYQRAGLDFKSTGYFEAHGTGTAVGDPIEASGISQAFSAHRDPANPLAIGSVKANIGHLESSAGLAGLIKAVLVLEKGVIPPNALLRNLNPKILADKWHLNFPTTPIPWPTQGLRRASVNSFGYGGTNAHTILDDALHYLQSRNLRGRHNVTPLSSQNGLLTNGHAHTNGVNGHGSHKADPEKLLFLLSAADENGIGRQASSLEAHLAQSDKEQPETYLRDVAYTLSRSRALLPWKSYVLASSASELRKGLLESVSKPVRSTKSPTVHFVFTGQGAQWASMGVELLSFPVFRESVEHADAYLRSIGSRWSVIDELCKPAPSSSIHSPNLAQPLCTVLQMALVDLLASWNIHPQAVVGHSSGEIAAAYCAGGLSRDSALRVAYFRGECVSELLVRGGETQGEQGGMLAVGLSAEELRPHVEAVLGGDRDQGREGLQCGCLNSPKSTTVTGLDRHIDALATRLEQLKIFARKLNVPVAYHSRQMLAVADSYRASLEGHLEPGARGAQPGAQSPALFSSVTGSRATKADLSCPEYWVQNLVSPVRFSEALSVMYNTSLEGNREDSQAQATRPLTYVVEVGPHCSLERPIRDTLPEEAAFVYDYTLRRNSSSADDVKSLAGRSAAHGYAVDVAAVNSQRGGRGREPRVLLDLPKYAFNHSQSYWVESRLSRSVRTREQPRHELLGTRSNDWNPLRPTWRLVIRDSDLAWVSDHKVDGIILYPAAGMLVMAIEGLRSLQTDLSRVSGFSLKDVNIGSALVVPPGDEGVETQLHLGPCNPTSDTQKGVSAWFFWIHSVTNDEWKLHCSGQISVVENAADDIVSEDPTAGRQETPAQTRTFGAVRDRCSTPIDRKAFYQAVLDKSIDLGDTFRTMHDIRFNESRREATANLPLGAWRRQVRDAKLSEHLIHPTTLDGLLHIPFASIFPRLPVIPSVVPRQITEIYISKDLLSDEAAGETLRLYGNTTELGVFHINADVSAVGASSEKPLVHLRGLKLLGFHATDSRGAASSGPSSLFHRFEYKPDVSFLSRAGIEDYCREHAAAGGELGTSGFDGEMERVCRYFLSAMLDELDATAGDEGVPAVSSKPPIQSYVRWARSFLESEAESTARLREAYPGYEDASLRPGLIESFASKSVQNRDTVDYGRKLVPIVRDQVDALALLFNDGLAERLYQSPTFSLTSHRLAAYMDLVAHKKSDLRILECGAGTGSTTTAVLDVLSRPSVQAPRFSHYDFTDISPSFFADAAERYAAHAGRIGFKVFDLERDPEEQGFEAGSYDVVIAAAVIHATSSIDKSLRNIKKLLKPGGQIVFWEPTSRRIASIPFFVGVLPGWWLSTEKVRSNGPLLTEPEWNEALLQADFDGLQVSLRDDDDGNHVNSLLVSHVKSAPSTRESLSTLIVTGTKDHEGLASQLQAHLRSRSGAPCDVVHADHLAQAGAGYDQCICLVELGNPIMAHLDATRFEALRRVTCSAAQILWVTDGCGLGAQNPEASIVAGFAKVLERERPGLSFVHLSLHDREGAGNTILRVVDQSRSLASQEDQETDILEEGGQILVPRAVEAPDVNRLLDAEKHGLQPRLTQVGGGEETLEEEGLELRFSPGRLQSLHFGPDASSTTPPADDEVRVLVKAAGVNFRDVMVTLNQVSDSHMGAEFAGVVIEAGTTFKSAFLPGDRVCGPLDGSFRSVVRIPGRNLIKIPPDLTFAEAASVPVAYATAQYALRYLARIQPGESILVHAAAGGVGQAAVHLAQRAGASVYATVSTPDKKKILMERFGIPASNIFSSRHTLFASQILERTPGGRGVDVVLNSLAGHALAESWRVLAPLGRFVEIGKRDIRAFNRLPMEPFVRNVSFSSLDLKVLADHNPALLSTIMREIQELVWDQEAREHLVPYPLTVYKRSGLEEAFRLLQSGRHSGKVVVDWEQADTIKVVPKSPLDYSFDPNATYVITGGLGGIGRNLAGWMARNGARNLCLMSRSGPVTAASRDLVRTLEHDGVRLYTPACDISDTNAVADVVAHMKEAHFPPVKGCIHSAMAIENRVFENYDLPTFNSAFPAKVRGTRNLHNHLPRGMDFFVILGSIAAFIGPASQSNYAGVSSFQDAFARARRAQGEHCVTIDLGAVEGIGYIAERVAVARNVDMMFVDHKILREPDIHFMMKWACNPRLSAAEGAESGSPWAANVVAGLTTPAFVRRGGILRDHKWMRIPMFRHLYRMELETGQNQQGQGGDGDGEGGENAGALLAAAKTQAEAAGVVTHLFAKRLARSLAVPVEDIDVGRPAYAFGVDSLVAVELLFWFSSEIRADVPVVQILGSSTIAQLGAVAAAKSEHLSGRELPA